MTGGVIDACWRETGATTIICSLYYFDFAIKIKVLRGSIRECIPGYIAEKGMPLAIECAAWIVLVVVGSKCRGIYTGCHRIVAPCASTICCDVIVHVVKILAEIAGGNDHIVAIDWIDGGAHACFRPAIMILI